MASRPIMTHGGGMPRKPRSFLPDVPVHMIVRGNRRGAIWVNTSAILPISSGSRTTQRYMSTGFAPMF